MTENLTNAIEETYEIETSNETPVKTTPKKRKTKAKMREHEELLEMKPSKMTDTEKEYMLNYYRGELNSLTSVTENMHKIIADLSEKCSRFKADYDAMELHYTRKLKYIEEQILACSKAIRLATKGEM